MVFLIKYHLDGDGTVEVEAGDHRAAEARFNDMSLECLFDHADFTGGVDVEEIVPLDEEQQA